MGAAIQFRIEPAASTVTATVRRGGVALRQLAQGLISGWSAPPSACWCEYLDDVLVPGVGGMSRVGADELLVLAGEKVDGR